MNLNYLRNRDDKIASMPKEKARKWYLNWISEMRDKY